MKRIFRKGKPGFALPMVTITIAALSLLLVALLTILNLERKTARTYSEISRAELAAESGLAVALAALTEISQRDDGLVFRIDDPSQPKVPSSERPLGYREQFFTYASLFDAGEWRDIPLFSGAKETKLGNARIVTTALQTELSTYLNDPNTTTLTQLTEHDQNIPRAKWVEVPSPDNSTDYNLRYAYWIEDLGGRIDGKHAASKPRAEGESSEEINYATILYPASDTPVLPAELIAARSKLRSSASLRQILSANEAKRLEPYIHFYGTAPAPPPPAFIPHGFSYLDAGQPAPDLNEFVTNRDVDGIAAHISLQIPNFTKRRGEGGFPEDQDYVKTIAASIIDYADTDSDATTGIDYRGIDSYPFVNEIADRYEWLKTSPEGEVWIKVETYIELWNPSQQSITGEIEFTNVNRQKFQLSVNDAVIGDEQFSDIHSAPKTVSLPPNGFMVLQICDKEFKFSGFNPDTPDELELLNDVKSKDNGVSANNFLLKWNGRLVDTARGGIEKTHGKLTGKGSYTWKGSASPIHHWTKSQWGDPRSSWYINAKIFGHTYEENSNWGGRALKQYIGLTNPYTSPTREVRLDKWPDRGSNSAPGVVPDLERNIPTETRIVRRSTGEAIAGKDYPPNEPDKAPAFISNAGRYTSLGELGHIFDPAQWKNVESNAAEADQKSGGGMTLAIGRPEFGAFDLDARWCAARLLDLFSLPASNPTAAKININTAPREVLRTLMADVSLDDDPVATSVKLKKQSEIGDIFADHVIAQRNSCPLRALSDLNDLRMNPLLPRDPANPAHTPFFGNVEHFDHAPKIMDPATHSTEWDDAGREELFRKVMNLVTFRSKMFRIVVAGEARSKQGQLLSRSTREVHLSIEPQRDAKGLIIPGTKPGIMKHFERALSSP